MGRLCASIVTRRADVHSVAVGVVLHDLNQAAAVADHVVLLADGRVRCSGTPAQVLTTERLSETYGLRVDVDVDSATGLLQARPVGRYCARAAQTVSA